MPRITKAAQKISRFVSGYDRLKFMDDEKIQSAVIYQIIVIGEAVKRLSVVFRQRHSEIPWRQIAGMRDQLVHKFELVDLEDVWRTAASDVPHLLHWIEQYLSHTSDS